MRRNAIATAELADACATAGVDLVLVSTNEVFDGRRTDGRGYAPDDRPAPANPYGVEQAGRGVGRPGRVPAPRRRARRGADRRRPAAGPGAGPQLAIVRTAWLFGPPGNDFPAKILGGADRARAAGEALRVVGDETGSPTFAPDLADAIVELLAAGSFAGVHHVVNAGAVSRAGWARAVLAAAARGRCPWWRCRSAPGSGRRRCRRGPSSQRRRCRRASRCVRGRPPSPSTSRSCFAGGPREPDDERPSAPAPRRRSRASRGVPSCATPTCGEASASCGAPARSGPSTCERTGLAGAAFVQANLSTSAPGVLRGLHFHRRQLDHWVVASGRAFVALVDVRPLIAGTADRPLVEVREVAADGTVTIPAGVAHGFLALEPLELVYLVTNEFDGSDELGFAWDDPLAGVPWPAVAGSPDGRPILSDRDGADPSLDELVDPPPHDVTRGCRTGTATAVRRRTAASRVPRRPARPATAPDRPPRRRRP